MKSTFLLILSLTLALAFPVRAQYGSGTGAYGAVGSGGSGGATNGIQQLNGNGTNTALYGVTVVSGNGLGLTNLYLPFGGTNVFYVSYSLGNDAAGFPQQGNAGRPWKTLTNAWSAAFGVVSNPVFVLTPEVHLETVPPSGTYLGVNTNYFPVIYGYGATVIFTNAADNGTTFSPNCFDMLANATNCGLTILGGNWTTGPQVTNNGSRFIFYGNTLNAFTNVLRNVNAYGWVSDCIHGTAGTHTSWDWFDLADSYFSGSFDLFTASGSGSPLIGGYVKNCTFLSTTNGTALGAASFQTLCRSVNFTKAAFFTWEDCSFYGDNIGFQGGNGTNFLNGCTFRNNLLGNGGVNGSLVASSGLALLQNPKGSWTNMTLTAGKYQFLTPFNTNVGPNATSVGVWNADGSLSGFSGFTSDALGNVVVGSSFTILSNTAAATPASGVNFWVSNNVGLYFTWTNGISYLLQALPAPVGGPTISQTNFLSGWVYSNTFNAVIGVTATVTNLTTSAALMELRIPGAQGYTNMVTFTSGLTNSTMLGFVPSGSTYTFTNTMGTAGVRFGEIFVQ